MKHRNQNINRLLLMLLMMVSSSIIATPAILVVDAKLKTAPDFKSVELASMNKGEAVDIKQRERGWYQIMRDNFQTGWITLLQVRFKPTEQSNNPSAISRLVSLRKGHSRVNATTGVRGIGEADIKKAKANFAALALVKEYQAGKDEARQYAEEIFLTSQAIKYEEKKNEN